MVSGHVAVQQAPASCPAPLELFTQSLHEGVHHPVAMLLLQIISILVAVRILSLSLAVQVPRPTGRDRREIVAGIVLGPSLLGHFFPETFGFLFAPDSLESLNILSQIGLILFMFIIGMELDLGILRKKGSQTLVISHASIIVPFFLGTVLAWQVYPEFGFGHTTFVPFALFIGISVSITAFPVLARIIQERNLGKTPMGMLAIASAANNDITAWCLLAAIIAIAKAGSVASAGYTLLCVILYVLFMFGLVRPFMRKLGNIYNSQEIISKPLVAFIFLVLILSSYITEVLGVHALFGAFVAGVIMPANLSFRRIMTEKVEDVALVLFLPLFFVFTGLRTEIGALNTVHLWVVCALFVAVSIVGKLAGAALSARFVGESWKDSLSIGVLMNTRGLIELDRAEHRLRDGRAALVDLRDLRNYGPVHHFHGHPVARADRQTFRPPQARTAALGESPYLDFVRASFQCAGFPETRKSVVRPVDRQTAHYGCALYDRYRDQSDERLRLFVREFCAAA